MNIQVGQIWQVISKVDWRSEFLTIKGVRESEGRTYFTSLESELEYDSRLLQDKYERIV